MYQYKRNLLPDCLECPLFTVDQVHNYCTTLVTPKLFMFLLVEQIFVNFLLITKDLSILYSIL